MQRRARVHVLEHHMSSIVGGRAVYAYAGVLWTGGLDRWTGLDWTGLDWTGLDSA